MVFVYGVAQSFVYEKLSKCQVVSLSAKKWVIVDDEFFVTLNHSIESSSSGVEGNFLCLISIENNHLGIIYSILWNNE